MTATDELRLLLDERGVEWEEVESCLATGITRFKAQNGVWMRYVDYDDYQWLDYDGDDPLAPAQAVEATLGRGTCHMEPATFPGEQLVAEWHCTACDEYADVELLNGAGKRPRFCPWCGAEVME